MPPATESPGREVTAAASIRGPIYRDLVLIQLAALVFLIDQFSKYLVTEFLAYRESFPAEGFLRITHTFNTGSAFGLFQGQNTPLILVSVVGIAVLVLLYRSQSLPTAWLRLSLGLQLGGAAGNLIDRLRLGHVTDWADVGPWPVFNLADASIVTGLIILAGLFLMNDRSRAGQPAVMVSHKTAAYNWCPVCDGEMRAISVGWRCTTCGVRERLLPLPASQSSGLDDPLG